MVGKSQVIETLKVSRNFWIKMIYSLGKRNWGGRCGKQRRNEEEEKKKRNRHREQVGAKTAQGKN